MNLVSLQTLPEFDELDHTLQDVLFIIIVGGPSRVGLCRLQTLTLDGATLLSVCRELSWIPHSAFTVYAI